MPSTLTSSGYDIYPRPTPAVGQGGGRGYTKPPLKRCRKRGKR